ncbi:hypothetical protein VSDG_04059 [Cytospora chrysosperma]|uniref:Carboxylic ester hydrolase n=1 Tax=Cytospora chrysosperma TaxID=252740 RepID=A0A423W0T7_CYTCH|nr:hypothetical protein VSDG_04059 [Valsa sordida]
MSLLTGIILATSALSSAANISRLLETSRLNRGSTCSDEAIDSFDVVVCKLWDRSVVNWPPAYIATRNISNPFANCYNATLNDEVTAIGFLRSKIELNPNLFSTATKQGPRTPEEIVDELLFNTPLDKFIASREKRDPVDLVWDSDGCTHAPNNPMGFGFLPAY